MPREQSQALVVQRARAGERDVLHGGERFFKRVDVFFNRRRGQTSVHGRGNAPTLYVHEAAVRAGHDVHHTDTHVVLGDETLAVFVRHQRAAHRVRATLGRLFRIRRVFLAHLAPRAAGFGALHLVQGDFRFLERLGVEAPVRGAARAVRRRVRVLLRRARRRGLNRAQRPELVFSLHARQRLPRGLNSLEALAVAALVGVLLQHDLQVRLLDHAELVLEVGARLERRRGVGDAERGEHRADGLGRARSAARSVALGLALGLLLGRHGASVEGCALTQTARARERRYVLAIRLAYRPARGESARVSAISNRRGLLLGRTPFARPRRRSRQSA